jgi:hypothetical protein
VAKGRDSALSGGPEKGGGMKLRTAGVRQLVAEVVASLPEPLTEDVIDDVLFGIEHRADWRQRYEDLCAELTKTVVNNWCGVWTERLVGGAAFKEVQAKSNTLSRSYSKLTLDGRKPKASVAGVPAKKMKGAASARTPTQKITEAAAAQMMSDYFQKNRATLHPSVRKHRERIIELLMSGLTAEEAFSEAVSHGT